MDPISSKLGNLFFCHLCVCISVHTTYTYNRHYSQWIIAQVFLTNYVKEQEYTDWNLDKPQEL